jgi:hypothetical protein
MALDFTRHSRVAREACVPCCVGNLGRCCTSELTVANASSVYIHFYNFRLLPAPSGNPTYTMIGNPYLDFSIEPFSARLPRIDLVSSSAPPGFSNYGAYGNNMTDTASAGLYPTSDGIVAYPAYNVTARAVPVTFNINAKTTEFASGTYREKYEVVKVNDTQYYADIYAQCNSDHYLVNCTWWRAVGEKDIERYPFFINRVDQAGVTRMIQMMNGLPGQESSGQVSSCNPLVVSGTSGTVCFPCGLWNPPDLQTYTGLANWQLKYSFNSGATYSTGIHNYSYQLFNYTMDWIITE